MRRQGIKYAWLAKGSDSPHVLLAHTLSKIGRKVGFIHVSVDLLVQFLIINTCRYGENKPAAGRSRGIRHGRIVSGASPPA